VANLPEKETGAGLSAEVSMWSGASNQSGPDPSSVLLLEDVKRGSFSVKVVVKSGEIQICHFSLKMNIQLTFYKLIAY